MFRLRLKIKLALEKLVLATWKTSCSAIGDKPITKMHKATQNVEIETDRQRGDNW